MNRNQLKNYAPQARRDFIQAMTDRAAYYGLTANKIEPVVERGDVAIIAGREFPRAVAGKRQALEARIQRQGFESTMEALAYTWFNRLVAIRFMELHDYLDHGYRVLSSRPATDTHEPRKDTELHGSKTEDKSSFRVSSGSFRGPEILQYAEYVDLPGLKTETVIDLKLDGNKEAELYRLLLVAQCNALNRVMPFLFEQIDDETELLLPDNLLHSDSLIRKLVSNLEAEDCESVEVLGWLYQFYIAERKDQVMARKSAVPTEDIPAVTQLFTPHWIVRYLVENSLGRLWLLNRPGSRLREQMHYYIEGEAETDFLKITRPEDIRLCDPAVGSGHILTYAFDLLTLIYQEEGYAPTEIPGLILRHNLHGLEICPRAAQLAGLALVFKAREKSRRFFQPEHLVRPHIIELCDVRFAENELRDYSDALGLGDLFNQPLRKLLHQFEEAKNFGSLIQPCLDEPTIANARSAIEANDLGGQLFLHETHLKVLRVLEQAEALTQRYHVVVANPPYLGGRQMSESLRTFAKNNYEAAKSDLFAMFIERGFSLVQPTAYNALITMQSWMFLSSFEDLRKGIVSTKAIVTMAHLGSRAFDTIGGEIVQATAFVIKNIADPTISGTFIRLTEGRDETEKANQCLEAIANPTSGLIFRATEEDFKKLPGSPIAYWVSNSFRRIFEIEDSLGDHIDARQGLASGDNNRFLRYLWEVNSKLIGISCSNVIESRNLGKTWFPINKGGPYRRWYGNWEYVIAYNKKNRDILKTLGNHLPSEHLYFKSSVSWSDVTSSINSFRYFPDGFIFDATGHSAFPKTDRERHILLCYCNNKFANEMSRVLNPTLHFHVGYFNVLPFPSKLFTADFADKYGYLFESLIALARSDWDNFETSWDFRDLPLLRPGLKGATLEASWRNWEAHCTAAIRRMQELETENNRLFIAAYGLEGELQPEVPEDQITLYRPNREEDIKCLLSYAIGCMMGRYSLDQPGLIYAHSGNVDFEKIYFATDTHGINTEKTEDLSSSVFLPCPSVAKKFLPDKDGIIPLLTTDWGFQDDATTRLVEFISVAWPKEHLEENLKFIADSLGPTGAEQPRDTIRRYFAAGFYKHHLTIYKRRPIYWLFASGKQRAVQCLVYLHRYHDGTLARMRTEYVIPLQGRIAARIDQLEGDQAKASSTSHRKKLQKEQDDLKKQQAELAVFEEKLKHAADQQISLDLDDGVKVNYGKFGDLLAETKAITGGKDDD